jgi:hypothetical protein
MSTTDLTVANEIARQLGGTRRLTAMVGAKDFVGSPSALTFKFAARATNGSNCLRVTLDPSDTYTVEFLSVRGTSVKEKAKFSDIYCDGLVDLFESTTGLYLSL